MKADFICMVGLPASGKSRIANHISNNGSWAEIVSSDSIRKEIHGDARIQGDNNQLFGMIHDKIILFLSNGKSVIFDATNVSYKHRIQLLNKLKKLDVHKTAVVVATPFDECVENNKGRDRVVPMHVMASMLRRFTMPSLTEGWDEIEIRWNVRNEAAVIEEFTIGNLFNRMNSFEQDNPHHQFTLGKHCNEAFGQIVTDDPILRFAARIHDIGKLETKSFHNFRGDPSEIAHFFGHDNVGAYNAMFVMATSGGFEDNEIIRVCNLIQFHMRPHFAKGEKAINKLKRLVGDEMFADLMVLHAADKAAH